MIVSVNGEKRELPEGMTVAGLLDALAIKAQGIAVDLNREIVPRRLFSETAVRDGDSVEIVRMVGGG